MSLLDFFERWLSTSSHKNNHQITFLIITGMVFVLLLTLLGCATISFEDQGDDDTSAWLGIVTLNSLVGCIFLTSLALGLELRILRKIMRLEYLKGHIGEKRPSSPMHQSRKLFPRTFSVTALFYGGVFLVHSASPFGLAKNSNLVFVRGRFTRSRSKKCFILFQEVDEYV